MEWASIRDEVGCESGKARGSTVRIKYERFLLFMDARLRVERDKWGMGEVSSLSFEGMVDGNS